MDETMDYSEAVSELIDKYSDTMVSTSHNFEDILTFLKTEFDLSTEGDYVKTFKHRCQFNIRSANGYEANERSEESYHTYAIIENEKSEAMYKKFRKSYHAPFPIAVCIEKHTLYIASNSNELLKKLWVFRGITEEDIHSKEVHQVNYILIVSDEIE